MIKEESSWGLKQSKNYPKLAKNIEADVAIIGGGLAGIFNAYFLAKAGLKVVVLEKDEKILQATTMYTTAFITKLIDSSFAELVKLFGPNKAKLVWGSGQDAIDLIAQIVQKENIECEFKVVPIYTYAQDQKEFEELRGEYGAVKKSGFEAELSKEGSKLNFRNSGFLKVSKQAMFHPIKFAQGLAGAAESLGAKIFTNSEVLAIEGLTLKTKTGRVSAKNVLIATYKPFTNQGTRFKKGMYVTYVYELEIAKGLIPEGMYLDMHNPYHYFRIDSFGVFDRMIAGGEDNRKEIKVSPDKSFNALEKYIKTVLGGNKYKITRKWSGDILEPSDGLGLIGEIMPHTFVVTGFSGNGMTYSAISAMIVRDQILGKKNRYINLYDPKRIPSIKQISGKGLDYMEEFFGGAFKNIFFSKK
ncbi:MAG: FAD-binding oxidoreductase [Candidatus Doudnabacteria bacterium]